MRLEMTKFRLLVSHIEKPGLNFPNRTENWKTSHFSKHLHWVGRVNVERLSFLARSTVVWFRALWDDPSDSIICYMTLAQQWKTFLTSWLMRQIGPLCPPCSQGTPVPAFVTGHHMFSGLPLSTTNFPNNMNVLLAKRFCGEIMLKCRVK